MDVTAREVNEAQFHDAWRGYNQGEVDDFLDRVAETIDLLERDNQALRARLTDLETKMAGSLNAEQMLKQTLVSAQQTAEEAIARAKAKAEQLLAEAEERVRRADERVRERMQQAENEVRRRYTDADREVDGRRRDLEASVERLRAQQSKIAADLKAYLEQQMKALEGLSGSGASPTGGTASRPEGSSGASPAGSPAVRQEASAGAASSDVDPRAPEPVLSLPEPSSETARADRAAGRGRVKAWFTRSDRD